MRWKSALQNRDIRQGANAESIAGESHLGACRLSVSWRERVLIACVVVAVLSLSAACRRVELHPAKQVAAETSTVRLMTGTPGGGFYPVGADVAAEFARKVPSLTIDHRESAGSISNVTALEAGEADVALVYADVAYLAFTGSLEGRSRRFDHLRGIAVLHLAPVHLVVGPGSGISDVADLRGRRVGVGTLGSGTALTAELILLAFGIEPSSIQTRTLRYDDAADRLVAGDLDAMFVIGSDPVDAVRVALAAGGALVQIDGPSIDRLRHEYPFFHLAVVRRSAYQGQTEAVRTIGVESLLLCRDSLPEALVHDLTARLFEVQPSVAALREMDLEHAPAVPIPLHEGAARFYREREIFR